MRSIERSTEDGEDAVVVLVPGFRDVDLEVEVGAEELLGAGTISDQRIATTLR